MAKNKRKFKKKTEMAERKKRNGKKKAIQSIDQMSCLYNPGNHGNKRRDEKASADAEVGPI